MREVAVIGVGMTNFGELWDMSLRSLFVEAALGAMKSAGTDSIDSIYVGNMSGGQFVGQEHLGPLMADHWGLGGVPASRGESLGVMSALHTRYPFSRRRDSIAR